MGQTFLWLVRGVQSLESRYNQLSYGRDDVSFCEVWKTWCGRQEGTGNTHYTFLSRRRSLRDPRGVAIDKTPVESIRGNARFYKKLRFSLTGGRYPDPSLKPFLDDHGKQTDDGRFSFRPNPAWFQEPY